MLLDRSECVIQLLAEQEVVIGGLDEALQTGKILWDRIVRESAQILSKISPIMRAHAGKIISSSLILSYLILSYLILSNLIFSSLLTILPYNST